MASLVFTTNSAPSVAPFRALHSRTTNGESVFVEPSHVRFPRSISSFSDGAAGFRGRTKGWTVVTRAGPSTSTFIYAFSIPLTLIAVTVFASIRIADKLDDDFVDEVLMNQLMKEAETEDGDETEISLEDLVQEPVLERTRNRPKREA